MLLPITLVLLVTISIQTSPVQSRSRFRGISSDELDTASSGEIRASNKTSTPFIRNHPYNSHRSGQSNYGLVGLGSNGRVFRIPDTRPATLLQPVTRRQSVTPTTRCGIVPQFGSGLGGNLNESFVSTDQIPWQAAIFTVDGQFLCSGVLVSPKHVLTAEICLLTLEYVKAPHLLQVRVGAWELQGMVSSSEEANFHFETVPSQIFIYPEMNLTEPKVTTSKIALLELKEGIDLEKHSNIRPICLESFPMPSQDRSPLHDSSSEGFVPATNVIGDKKQDAQGKRNKKDSAAKKKTRLQLNGKKKPERMTASKSVTTDRNANDYLECYVSGWGSQSQPSVSFLTKQMQKQDLEERASISSLTVPIIPGGKYVVEGANGAAPAETPPEVTAWRFKTTSGEATTIRQEILINASDSESDLSALLEEILTASRTDRPTLPKLDPIEDYLDSVETRPTMETNYINTAKATQSKSRKKQLKPEKEFPESYAEILPTFGMIESDELLMDKHEADEEERLGASARNRNLRLKWSVVSMHNVNSAENVDLGLGTVYLKPARSKVPGALCMVDIGSPVVCSKRVSLTRPRQSNAQKILAGIVTWKTPCFGARVSEDIVLEMNELQTNYRLTQVTPIKEILDFVAERIRESVTSAASASGTNGTDNTVVSNAT